jgi:hypothetical protein
MTTVTWDDEAQCEFNCSALWYAKRGDAELGERFIASVEAAVHKASPLHHCSIEPLMATHAKYASSASLMPSYIWLSPKTGFTFSRSHT